MLFAELFDERKHVLLILGSRVIRADVVRAHKVMPDTLHLLFRRRRRAYLHASIYLSAVAVQDGAPELFGHLKSKFCLADSRRTKQNVKRHYSSIS